ncbi:MAG: hypothetical protein SFW36_04145 [Leptolyngbyaceae cyanobacterium bins.59]|nr:hypothetical protein [Leptolyngbyaceae cyanobacterium bins.59]
MLTIATLLTLIMLCRWATQPTPASPIMEAPGIAETSSQAATLEQPSIALETEVPTEVEVPQAEISTVIATPLVSQPIAQFPMTEASLKPLHYTMLRSLCAERGIGWKDAHGTRKNLTSAEMRALLLQQTPVQSKSKKSKATRSKRKAS